MRAAWKILTDGFDAAIWPRNLWAVGATVTVFGFFHFGPSFVEPALLNDTLISQATTGAPQILDSYTSRHTRSLSSGMLSAETMYQILTLSRLTWDESMKVGERDGRLFFKFALQNLVNDNEDEHHDRQI